MKLSTCVLIKLVFFVQVPLFHVDFVLYVQTRVSQPQPSANVHPVKLYKDMAMSSILVKVYKDMAMASIPPVKVYKDMAMASIPPVKV